MKTLGAILMLLSLQALAKPAGLESAVIECRTPDVTDSGYTVTIFSQGRKSRAEVSEQTFAGLNKLASAKVREKSDAAATKYINLRTSDKKFNLHFKHADALAEEPNRYRAHFETVTVKGQDVAGELVCTRSPPQH